MRRLALLASVVALGLVGLTGCGNKPDVITRADTEGLYLGAGGLKYQIQISRQLNPALVEDRAVLRGLPGGVRDPGPNAVYFGVWLRVENDGQRVHKSSDNFEISDTQGNRYAPLAIDPNANILAYRPSVLGPAALYPDVDSVAASCCPRAGAVLVFKLKRSVYENRPLEFAIRTTGTPLRTLASVELDL